MISVTGIKAIYDMLAPIVKYGHEYKITSRKRFFGTIVEPSYGMFERVHKDYIKTFLELRRIFMQEEWPSQETAKWLTQASIEFITERDRLKVIGESLNDVDNFFGNAANGEGQEIYDTFFDFCKFIEAHFASGHIQIDASYYGHFLAILESKQEIFDKQFNRLIEIGAVASDDNRGDVLRRLRAKKFDVPMIQNEFDNGVIFDPNIGQGTGVTVKYIELSIRYLRENFARVTVAYNKLSSLCSYE